MEGEGRMVGGGGVKATMNFQQDQSGLVVWLSGGIIA